MDRVRRTSDHLPEWIAVHYRLLRDRDIRRLRILTSCIGPRRSGAAAPSGHYGFRCPPRTPRHPETTTRRSATPNQFVERACNLPTSVRSTSLPPGSACASALAALEGAEVLWLPTITLGGDYNHHDGRVQDSSGNISNNSHSSAMLGMGTGIGPAAILDVGQAIFAPLVARQQVRARQADRQTASNDTLVAVSDAYFTVQQARGELAGAIDTTRRTKHLVARTRKLAPEIVPDLELLRVETELARRQEAELLAREHWQVASADLLRMVRWTLWPRSSLRNRRNSWLN